MTGQREPGRYNLHRLGWSAFEDLCMQVMRVVLGETCSRYRPGPDEGRDGWFQGNASDKLAAESGLTGNFVVQCKHTSDPSSSVTKSTFSKDLAKATELARKEPFHYIAMMNGRLTAENERTIRFFACRQDSRARRLKRPPLIAFGFNKDHRPDLKQLVYSLAVTADGSIPVHYKTYDGDTTDDKTHIKTWNTIHDIAGGPHFLYVADSKLCTSENMRYIAGHRGTFLTVLPRSRHEDDAFRKHVQEQPVNWQEVRRKRNPRKYKPDMVHEAFEPKDRSAEGYRVVWYRSSVKRELDEKRRKKRIHRAKMRLQTLEARTGAHRFRSIETARKAVDEVLQEEGAQRWLHVDVLEDIVKDFKQTSPGRPGKRTKYRRLEIPVILFEVEEIADAIQADAKCDGLFAMVTNREDLSPKELLAVYKYQPFLEKRNEQLKSVLAVAPVFLKKPERVAALLFLYFLAVLVFALIEREARRQMVAHGIDHLPIYPEDRARKAPTTDGILGTLEGIRRSELLDSSGRVVKTFHDPVPPVARQLIKLLGVPRTAYGLR